MVFTKTKESAVGLEIGTYSIRAVELKKSTPYELTHYATENLGSGVVIDGEIIEVNDIVQALRKLWAKGKFTTKKVTLGIANPKVLIRQVELPYMEDSALRNAINFQAQEYIPFPPEELILDYHVLGKFEGEDKQQMLEVLLVAAHKEMVSNFCHAVERAGLYVETVYLSALALARSILEPPALSDNKGEEEGTPAISTVVVNVGADITNIVVAEKGFARFARIMTIGGNDFTEAIADSLGIPFKEAEDMKKGIGILRPAPREVLGEEERQDAESVPQDIKPEEAEEEKIEEIKPEEEETEEAKPEEPEKQTEETAKEEAKQEEVTKAEEAKQEETAKTEDKPSGVIDSETRNKIASMLKGEANKFITELRRSVEYYFGEDIHKQSISKIVLSGGGAEMAGFDGYIAEKLKIETEKGRVLNKLNISRHIRKELVEEMENHEPSLGVVVGLAMRGIE